MHCKPGSLHFWCYVVMLHSDVARRSLKLATYLYNQDRDRDEVNMVKVSVEVKKSSRRYALMVMFIKRKFAIVLASQRSLCCSSAYNSCASTACYPTSQMYRSWRRRAIVKSHESIEIESNIRSIIGILGAFTTVSTNAHIRRHHWASFWRHTRVLGMRFCCWSQSSDTEHDECYYKIEALSFGISWIVLLLHFLEDASVVYIVGIIFLESHDCTKYLTDLSRYLCEMMAAERRVDFQSSLCLNDITWWIECYFYSASTGILTLLYIYLSFNETWVSFSVVSCASVDMRHKLSYRRT